MFTTTHDAVLLIWAAFFTVHYLTGALFFFAGRQSTFVESPSLYLVLILALTAVAW